MIAFITANWISILVVVLFIVAMVVLVRFGYRKQVKDICFYLVTRAEQEFGSGTGQLKYATVVTWLYERLPGIVKFFITDKTIDRLIEDAVTRMKNYLDTNYAAKTKIMTE